MSSAPLERWVSIIFLLSVTVVIISHFNLCTIASKCTFKCVWVVSREQHRRVVIERSFTKVQGIPGSILMQYFYTPTYCFTSLLSKLLYYLLAIDDKELAVSSNQGITS